MRNRIAFLFFAQLARVLGATLGGFTRASRAIVARLDRACVAATKASARRNLAIINERRS